LITSDRASVFAQQVHPIFKLAACPQAAQLATLAGCDVVKVQPALQRLMNDASLPGAAVR
jgi:hypothetical protein